TPPTKLRWRLFARTKSPLNKSPNSSPKPWKRTAWRKTPTWTISSLLTPGRGARHQKNLLLYSHRFPLLADDACQSPQRSVDGFRIRKDFGNIRLQNHNIASLGVTTGVLAARASGKIVFRFQVRLP